MKKKALIITMAAAILAALPTTMMASQLPAEGNSLDNSKVEIVNYTDTKASDRIQEVLEKGRSVGAIETFSIQADQEDSSLVNYMLIDGNTRYLYEKSPVQDKEKIVVYEDTQPAKQPAPAAASDQLQAVAASLPGGIGGKAVVKKNGSYVNATVRLATASQLTGAPSGATYTYMGFSGTGRKYDGSTNNFSIETDMGLQYSNAYGYVKWTPILGLYNGKKMHGSYLSGYEKVQYKNGFKGGSDVNLTAYRNLNGNTRLSVSGYAVCPDMGCSQQKDTYLTSVMEVANSNVSSVNKWKMLATIAGSENVTGHNYAEFKNVNVDGVSQVPTVEAEDYATVSVSGSTVKINVSR